MTLTDYALESFVLKEPIQLFYTDGNHPLSVEVKTMEDIVNLLETIHENGWQPGIGNYSIEFQLWFALARKAKLFK